MLKTPANLQEWEQAYYAVIADYEDELEALEAEKAKIDEDAKTLGQVIASYQSAQIQWKAAEQRLTRKNAELSEDLGDTAKRLAQTEEFLVREGYQRQSSGKWYRMR